MTGRKGNTFRTPEAREELLTGLLALLARRPELRDVGIAGYLVGAAVDGAPGDTRTSYFISWGMGLRGAA